MPPRFPHRAEDVAYRMLDDEMILVGARRGRILSLNPVGAMIWQLADGQRSVEDIAGELSRAFDVDFEPAAKDVEEFLGELVSKGTVGFSDGPESPQ